MSKNISVKKIVSTTKEVSLHIDGITLLSVDEYRKVKNYIKPLDFNWWFRSPGDNSYHAARVNGVGIVYFDGFRVDSYLGVRPALRINLKSSDFQIGDSFRFGAHTWTVITKDYALCDTTICNMPFREDWQAQDANDYEKSDIKKFLKDWYLKQISEQPTGENKKHRNNYPTYLP